jgi:acetyl esterase/lipase
MPPGVHLLIALWIVSYTAHTQAQAPFASDQYPSPQWYADSVSWRPPSRVSPDGKSLLFVDNTDPKAQTRRIVNIETGAVEHELLLQDHCLRDTWSPDGKRIFFSCFRGYTRDMFLWNTETGKVDPIQAPRTRALSWQSWSPDGRSLALKSTNGGLKPGNPDEFILLDSAHLTAVRLPLAKTVSKLSWAPDSKRFALLDSSRPHAIDVIDLNGNVLHSWNLAEKIKITAVEWAPRSESLIVSYREPAQRGNNLGLFSLADGRLQKLAALPEAADSILWSPDEESVYFQYDIPDERPILRLRLGAQNEPAIIASGSNEIRGITPDPKTLFLERRGTLPNAWYRIRLAEQKTELIYQPTTGRLPAVPGRTVWINAQDGFRVPILEYRSPKPISPPAAAIEVHGGARNSHEYLEWHPERQKYLREGIHFLGVNYRGSSGYGKAFSEAGNARAQTLDILAAVHYAHNTLGVPYRRIAVYGSSDGASLVALAARQEPEQIAIAGLISFDFPSKSIQEIPLRGCPRRIILQHPAYDYISLEDTRGLLAAELGPSAVSDAVLRLVQVESDHQISSVPSAFPAFSEILVEELKRTSTPAPAPTASATGGRTR